MQAMGFSILIEAHVSLEAPHLPPLVTPHIALCRCAQHTPKLGREGGEASCPLPASLSPFSPTNLFSPIKPHRLRGGTCRLGAPAASHPVFEDPGNDPAYGRKRELKVMAIMIIIINNNDTF